jgi:predicted MFS family arabinose efflux permease
MPIVLVLILCAICFVTSKGYRVTATLLAVDLGAGPLQTGVLFALWGLFPFLLSVYAGRLADRFDSRVLMLWGLAGFSASLTLPFFFPSLAMLYLSMALGGLTTMLFVVATQNLVGVLATPETRSRYFSYYSLFESTGSVAGPVLAGLSIDAFRHPVTFLFIALFNAAGLALLLAKRGRIPNVGRHDNKPAAKSAKDLLALPALRRALLANGAVMAGLDLFNLYMPVYTHGLKFSATAIGLIMGAFGAAAFLTRLAIPVLTRRWGEHTTISAALLLSACAFVAVPLTAHPMALAAAAFVLGLGLGCGQPLSMLLSFNAAPPGRSAEAIAMRLSVSYGAHIVIPPVFGVIGAVLGMTPIFWSCALVLAGGSALTRPKRRVG